MPWLFALLLAALITGEISAPVHEEGDRWAFRITRADQTTSRSTDLNGDYEVTFKNGAAHSEVESEVLLRLLGLTKNDPQHYLQFPLQVGKKWKSQYTITGSQGPKRVQVHRVVEYEVTGTESVQAKAGNFDAVVIKRVDSNAGGLGNTIEHIFHYSPQTKSIVKGRIQSSGLSSARTDIELLKYIPAKP